MGFEILVLRYSLQKYTVFTDLVNFVVKIFRRTCQYLRKKKSADTEMNISFHFLLKKWLFSLCHFTVKPTPLNIKIKYKQVGGGGGYQFLLLFKVRRAGLEPSAVPKIRKKHTNILLLMFQNKKGVSMIVKQNTGRYQKSRVSLTKFLKYTIYLYVFPSCVISILPLRHVL